MRTNRISAVISMSHKRPQGYIEEVKAHSELWDEKAGVYQITDVNWNKLVNKYRYDGKVCEFAVANCCGQPSICRLDGSDCPDKFNSQCGKIPK